MIEFNEEMMTKASFTRSFVLSDGNYGLAPDDEDCPDGDFQETRHGQECWIFNTVKANKCQHGEMVFVYIPEYDHATTVLSRYVTKQ